jgi:hypothetical protein
MKSYAFRRVVASPVGEAAFALPMLIRVSAITPRPTQRCIPSSSRSARRGKSMVSMPEAAAGGSTMLPGRVKDGQIAPRSRSPGDVKMTANALSAQNSKRLKYPAQPPQMITSTSKSAVRLL